MPPRFSVEKATEVFQNLKHSDDTLGARDVAKALTKLGHSDDEVSRLTSELHQDGGVVRLEEFLAVLQRKAAGGGGQDDGDDDGERGSDGDEPEDDLHEGPLSEEGDHEGEPAGSPTSEAIPEEDWGDEEAEVEVYEDDEEWFGVDDDLPFDETEVEKLEHFSFPPDIESENTVLSEHTKDVWTRHTGKALHLLAAGLAKVVAKLQDGILDLTAHQLDDAQACMLADALEHDSRLEHVAEVTLCRNYLSSVGGVRVIAAVTPHPSIVRLNLSGNLLGDKQSHLSGEGCGPALGRLLRANTTLRQLVLSRNRLSDADVVEIAEGLCDNGSLHSLDLAENALTWVSGEAIRVMLSTNADLRELNLGWNQLSTKGTMLVLEGLRANNVLKKISLSWNGITDKGGVAVGEVLLSNSSLEEVDISHNRVGTLGSLKIAEGLQQNGTLRKLVISHNPLSDSGVTAIIRSLRDNSTCELVDMQGCQSGEGAAAELEQTQQARKTPLTLYFSFSSLPLPGFGGTVPLERTAPIAGAAALEPESP
eukprot:RCo008590